MVERICASYFVSISKLVSAPVDSYRYHLISERDVVEMDARRDKESKEIGIGIWMTNDR